MRLRSAKFQTIVLLATTALLSSTQGFDYCARGKNQSPVKLPGEKYWIPATSKDFGDYRSMGDTIVSRNGGLRYVPQNPMDGFLGILKEIVFRVPSEHTIGGVKFDMEAQFLFRNSNRQKPLTVVALLFQVDPEFPDLDSDPLNYLLDDVPVGTNWTEAVLPGADLRNFFEFQRRTPGGYISYEGSLTYFPCSEGVTWIVYREPQTMSLAQLELIQSVTDSKSNARANIWEPTNIIEGAILPKDMPVDNSDLCEDEIKSFWDPNCHEWWEFLLWGLLFLLILILCCKLCCVTWTRCCSPEEDDFSAVKTDSDAAAILAANVHALNSPKKKTKKIKKQVQTLWGKPSVPSDRVQWQTLNDSRMSPSPIRQPKKKKTRKSLFPLRLSKGRPKLSPNLPKAQTTDTRINVSAGDDFADDVSYTEEIICEDTGFCKTVRKTRDGREIERTPFLKKNLRAGSPPKSDTTARYSDQQYSNYPSSSVALQRLRFNNDGGYGQ